MFGHSSLRAQTQRDRRGVLPEAPARVDALRNTGSPPNRPPTGPERPGPTGPGGANQQRGGGGAGWISRLVLLLLLLVVGYNIVLWWNPQNNTPTISYSYSD